MKYGYIDESGTAGVAANSNDFLVVSLVLFDTKADAEGASVEVDRLRGRLGLKKTYEFHCSRNTGFAQKGMLRLISRLNFRFITISIKKTASKKDASYARIAGLLVQEIDQYCKAAEIEMDSNPILHKVLKKELKSALPKIKLREVESKNSNLIQLADYVASISAKKVKNVSRADEYYRPLLKKQLVLRDIRDEGNKKTA